MGQISRTAAVASAFALTPITVDFGYPASRLKIISVADPDITAGESLAIFLAGAADTFENEGDMLEVLSLSALAQNGSLQITAAFLTPFGGSLKLSYVAG